ncbi:MAG: hypothetical protein E7329_10895 [Clostridiales bacterium]|nr:hypothetical protein [Clostridiales bacterium]
MPRAKYQEDQRRAAYPPEPEQKMVCRTEDDWAAYPDSVYESQYQEDEAEAAPYAPIMPGRNGGWAHGGSPRKPKHTALWAFIALICVALLSLMGYAIASMYEAYVPFRQKVNIVNQGTFAQGVLVDNIHIGGMNRAQAEAALATQDVSGVNRLNITLQVDGYTWVITPNELPFERNIQSVLDTAYAIGRQGTAETVASSMTPFEYRYAHLYHTVTNAAYLYTQVTYDRVRVRELVGIIENNINRQAVDAQVASFDFSTRTFTFTQDQAGAILDGESLYQQIIAALDRQDYSAVIYASSTPVMPSVTRVELMNSFSLVSSYTTDTTSDANRNNNVDLACRAIMGTVLMPGDTFSFNGATGQRTTEKGYLPAAAIAGGTTVDEVGGGVCQVSSTLFNAAVKADMTILQRYPHAWPSNYVDKGRDATVNWPNLDFTFRNDKTTPVFIVAYYQQRKCTVEIYGASLGPGVSIDLSSRVIDTVYPPEEPLYEQNPQLPPGTVQEKKKARIGYEVDTFKIYYSNGVEVKRELLCTSTYKMIQQVLEFN